MNPPHVGKCRNRWPLNYLRPHHEAAQGGPSPAQLVAGRDTDMTGRASKANLRSTVALPHEGHGSLASAEARATSASNGWPQSEHAN